MIDYYNNKYTDSDVTDFNEGSEIRNLLEAVACDIFHLEYNDQQMLRAGFLPTSYGSFLDLFGEELDAPRTLGVSAQGTVTFSISEALTYPITIPQYTRLVASSTGLFYQTYMTVEIPVGETSVDCPVFSEVPGAGTNTDAGTIDLFYDDATYSEVSVTNAEAITGGTDTESDEDYRARLMEIKSQDGFGSMEYYKRLGKVAGVHDIAIVDSASYTGKVLVNPYTKPLTNTILVEVTAQYTNEKNLVYNHSFEVAECAYTTVPLELTAVVSDEVEDSLFTDCLSCIFNGGETLIANTQINCKGASINESLTNYQILTILEQLPFVIQITNLTSDESTFTKLTPDTNKSLKLGVIQITQQISE